MNRRRAEFESLRDSMLMVAGRLDQTMGGPAVNIVNAPYGIRRAVYGFIDRQNLPGVFRTFDFANPDVSSPQRHQTTVPQQALFLMNSPFVLEQAKAITERSDFLSAEAPEQRIGMLYSLIFGRAADADETEMGTRFVNECADDNNPKISPWAKYAQVLLLANEFVYVD
jgi:hypothetical protein